MVLTTKQRSPPTTLLLLKLDLPKSLLNPFKSTTDTPPKTFYSMLCSGKDHKMKSLALFVHEYIRLRERSWTSQKSKGRKGGSKAGLETALLAEKRSQHSPVLHHSTQIPSRGSRTLSQRRHKAAALRTATAAPANCPATLHVWP